MAKPAIKAVVKEQGTDLFYAYVILIAWLPLPLGSNRPWAWGIMEVIAFGILLFWLVSYSKGLIKVPKAVTAAKAPLILLVIWLLYTLLQGISLPVGLVKSLSPATFELYAYAFGEQNLSFLSMSVEQGATLAEFLKFSAYVAIFFLTLALVNSHGRLKQLATLLVLVALSISIYGLIMKFTGSERIWLMEKSAYRGYVTGTFVSRNHFAGFLEMMIPLAIGLFIAQRVGAQQKESVFTKGLRFLTSLLDNQGRMIVYIVIMLAALFLSGSRSGVAILFISLAITLVFSLVFCGLGTREARFAPFLLGIALLAAGWMGMGNLAERMADAHYHIGSRIIAWENAMGIISDFPITGSGAGTFKAIFPMYEDGRLYKLYDHAHNDYIEILTDQGLIGLFLLFSAVGLLMGKVAIGFMTRTNLLARGILFASMSGCTALLIHGVIDFNFHISANAAYFFVFLGLGIVASNLKKTKIARRIKKPDFKSGQPPE